MASFGSSTAHKALRKMLIDQKLDAVVKLPSGVFRPTRASRPQSCSSPRRTPVAPTTCGSTTWADGFSLDDKRNPIEANDLHDVLARWRNRDAEKDRARTDQSFLVPKADIVAQGYDLSSTGTKRSSTKRSSTAPRSTSSRTSRSWTLRSPPTSPS
jgi:type I restriction enzyme M protein